jgi:hypothetical protein
LASRVYVACSALGGSGLRKGPSERTQELLQSGLDGLTIRIGRCYSPNWTKKNLGLKPVCGCCRHLPSTVASTPCDGARNGIELAQIDSGSMFRSHSPKEISVTAGPYYPAACD